MIHTWFTDNEVGFDGPDTTKVAAELILNHERTVANEHGNPVSENHWRNLEAMIVRCLGYANEAPPCLWSWVARQMDIIMYYLVTKAHDPPVSPYRFSNPDDGPADVSWLEPILCDVTVHLSERDQLRKPAYTSATACYLRRDVNRNTHMCYMPSLSRISTYKVLEFRRSEFNVCQSITADTPVEYYELNEFRMGSAANS